MIFLHLRDIRSIKIKFLSKVGIILSKMFSWVECFVGMTTLQLSTVNFMSRFAYVSLPQKKIT